MEMMRLPLCTATPPYSQPHLWICRAQKTVHGVRCNAATQLSLNKTPPLPPSVFHHHLPYPTNNLTSSLSSSSLTPTLNPDAAATTLDDIAAALQKSISHLFSDGGDAITSSMNNITQSIDDTLYHFLDQFNTGAIHLLTRTALVYLLDYLAKAINFILYFYASAKEFLPQQLLDVLNTIEQTLKPLVNAFRQAYLAIEVLERNAGFDPNDPVLQFALFLATSITLGITYQVLTYGGYAGDLAPKLTLELLTSEDNAVLIDVRPEELQERDGVPDLRQGARFKYASVALPKIDGTVKSLVKSGRDLNDALIAAVILNLKIVKDRSKVIVLDADGSYSKRIARSLSKLGVKKPYLVQGGFQSWVRNGLRTKVLKPETMFSILNEEAEAILDDIKPTTLQIFGYGVGLIVGSYALFEWEKTLELVGIIGVAQTIYQRISSYQDSDDFKQDVRLLLAPLQLGAQAFSWVAGKLEPSRIGLPTSPSSSDVQNRVLLVAAKHESQPSEAEENRELSRETMTASNENVDLSES